MMFEYLQQIDDKIYDRYLTLEKNIKSASNSFYDSYLDLQENLLKFIVSKDGIKLFTHESCGALLKRSEVKELFLQKYGLDSYTYEKMSDYAKKANEHKHRKEKSVEVDTIVSYMHVFYDLSSSYALYQGVFVAQFDGKYFKSIFGSMEKVNEKLEGLAEGQHEIITTLQHLQNRPNNIVESIQDPQLMDKQELIDFIKNAKRVFIYSGDKSALDRANKKKKRNNIYRIIILIALVGISLSVITLQYGWIPVIPVAIVAIPSFYYLFSHLKSNPYEYEYKSFKNKWARYYYDDNGIICGNDDKAFCKLIKILINLISFVEFVLLLSLSLFNSAYIYLIAVGITFILYLVNMRIFSIRNVYYLYFIDGERKIPYAKIKNFMTENGLK